MTDAQIERPPKGIRLKTLFLVFLRISAAAVGGGLVMVPMVTEDFSEKRRWMTHTEMVDCIAAVQSMPGIIGVNIAAAVGYRIAGVAGSFCAVVGMLLPPFFAILIIAPCFLAISKNVWVAEAFGGVRAAVCALILLAAVKLGKNVLKSPFAWIVASISFAVLAFFPQVNVIWVILAGAAAGGLRAVLTAKRKNGGAP